MAFLAFPLRLKGGFLKHCEEAEAIVSLVGVMARTPHGSWMGSSHFGLREFFEEARVRPELPQLALQELNLALQDLGIVHYRVESVAKQAQENRDVDSYVLTLASTEESDRRHVLPLER